MFAAPQEVKPSIFTTIPESFAKPDGKSEWAQVQFHGAATPTFSAIDPDKSGGLKLEELVKQLNALKVPTDDMVEIIRGIDRNGKLHGRLIIDN